MTTPRDPDERFSDALRDAMHAEADSIDPRGDGLMEIRDRVDSRSPLMRWSRPLAAVAAVVLVVGGVTAGVVLLRDDDSDSSQVVGGGPSSSVPTPDITESLSQSESPLPDPGGKATVPVYYLHDDGTNVLLYREFHRLSLGAQDPVTRAVNAAISGTPDDPDYTSLWPLATLARAEVHGDTISVDLSGPNLGASTTESEASIQQLVWTATAAAQKDVPVMITVNGKNVDSLFGVDISKPQKRHSPSYEVLGAVWILSPTEGQQFVAGGAGGRVRISGVATVFEATVSIDVVDSDGKVVKKTFATASEGAPGRGTWSKTVLLPPGDYVVKAYESSAQNGKPTHIDTKSFSVV